MPKHVTRSIFVSICLLLLGGVWVWVAPRPSEQTSGLPSPPLKSGSTKPHVITADLPLRLPSPEIDRSLSPETGEVPSLGLDVIMGWNQEQRELTPEERQKLLAYLSQPQPAGMEDGDWEEGVNEILNFLRGQTGEVPGLADQLVGMVGGEEISPVMRMYALQHIALWIPREPSEENRVAMVECLKRVAASPTDSHAGVALLFLSELESKREIPSDLAPGEFLERAALRLVSDASARPDVRISALHACTERETREVLPEARRMAADTTLMIPVRKAAIHCLRRLGGPEDRALLESIGADNRTLAEATKPALRRLAK